MREPELTKAYLEEHYLRLGKTRYQISEETGVTPARIGVLLQQFGIHRYTVQRHGLVNHPLNVMWCGMKERCQNPNAENYKWYGGRGITVCSEWQEFKPFYDWATSNGWENGLTIDRIDVNKPYSPDNCRFVPLKKQFRNRRSNVAITVDGETHLQCEWEEILGMRKKVISKWKYVHGLDYTVDRIREEKKHVAQRHNG